MLGEPEIFGDGEGEGEGCLGGVFSFRNEEFRCSLLALGVSSTVLPFSFLSSARTCCLALGFVLGLGRVSLCVSVWRLWWFGFWPGISFLGKTASRSSSELLGCGFSFDFFLLRLAAAKIEETRSSLLHWSFPEPQEPFDFAESLVGESCYLSCWQACETVRRDSGEPFRQ